MNAELEAEWAAPSHSMPSGARKSWVLSDTGETKAPWAWIMLKDDGRFYLDYWDDVAMGRGTWVHHAAFDTLEDAQAVGRIMAHIAMKGAVK